MMSGMVSTVGSGVEAVAGDVGTPDPAAGMVAAFDAR